MVFMFLASLGIVKGSVCYIAVIMRSIIQIMDKLRFLYLFALSALVSSQLTGPGGNCLGYCNTCDPYALANCKGDSPCLWGFYDPHANGTCTILPSYSLLSEEFGQRLDSASKPSISAWGSEATQQACEYFSLGKKKTIDVLGLFKGSHSIEKKFQVPIGSSQLQLSFSLVRDEWLPLNDFLMIEIADHSETLEMFQISYQTRASIKSSELNISCDSKRLKLEQYRIIINSTMNTSQIRVVFSSFLYQAVWGLTNLKLIAGCAAYTEVNNRTGKCSLCDGGSYFLEQYSGFGICKGCPGLCKTCKDQSICLQCMWGSLVNGKCSVSQDYKTQKIALPGQTSQCNQNAIYLNDISSKIIFPSIRNQHNNLYDEMLLTMTLFYDPYAIKTQTKAIIQVNGVPIMNVSLERNIAYTDRCSLFNSGRVAKIKVVGQLLPINDNAVAITIKAQGVTQIGVADVIMYSINKENESSGNTGALKHNDQQTISEVQKVDEEVNYAPAESQRKKPIMVSTGEERSAPMTIAVNQLKFDSQAPPLSQTHSFSTSKDGLLQLSIRSLSNSVSGMLIIQIDKLSPTDYDLVDSYFSNDNLIVLVKILKSFRDGKVTVKEMKGRRLQAGLMQIVAEISVARFDTYSLEQHQQIKAFGTIFSVFAWIGLTTIVLAIISGFGIMAEDYVITLQTLYLHVLIGYDLLPLTFREVVGELRGLGFLNYFTKVTSSGLSLNPQSQFWLFPQDFNFPSAFFPTFFTLLFYSLWFILLVCLKKWVFPRSIPDESRTLLHKLADNIVCRITNYIDSIWRYQLIAVLLISVMQFVSVHYQGAHTGFTWALTATFAYAGWLIFSEVYVRNQYYENEYSYFIYQFQDRYFCKIPLHSLPSRHHRLGYPLMRVAKSLLFVLIVCLIPFSSLSGILLMAVNTFQLWYIYFNQIYSQKIMLKFKAIQTILFLLIQLLILILSCGQLSSGMFKGWGFVISACGLLLIMNSLVRAGFIIRFKYIQMKGITFEEVDIDQKKLQTQRAV